MIRNITRDVLFLSRKGEPAERKDRGIAVDLLDTLRFHQRECIGMAANMIGARKNIIAVNNAGIYLVMLNPVITKKSSPFEAEEGCLSLDGRRKTKRYQRIEVDYQDLHFEKHHQVFEGLTSQIIQHECDHLNGILI